MPSSTQRERRCPELLPPVSLRRLDGTEPPPAPQQSTPPCRAAGQRRSRTYRGGMTSAGKNTGIGDPVESWVARGRVFAYKDLTPPYQKAIAHYMAVDGQAWPFHGGDGSYGFGNELNGDRYWADHLDTYVTEFATVRFGVVDVPMRELAAAVMSVNEDISDGWPDWETYHAWYRTDSAGEVGRGVPESSTETWPVVLDRDFDAVLDDGWHRLHHYYAAGLDVVPAVYYLRDEHYRAGPQ